MARSLLENPQTPDHTALQAAKDMVKKLRTERLQWHTEDKTFHDLNNQIKLGRYNLDPVHQRLVVHNDKWKSNVLHSAMFDGDIPDVYFHPRTLDDGTEQLESLDGKQRCSAINDYMNDHFVYKMEEPSFMTNKKYSELPKPFQDFVAHACKITIRISNRTLTESEIQSFFQKRQNFKKTTGGEHLNSCITSTIHEDVRKYIEGNSERLEKAGFSKNDRHQYTEAVSYILRTFKRHGVHITDCSPTKLKEWFTSSDPMDGDPEKAFKLVDHTLDLLANTKVKRGNSSKNAYISCAWYIMNHCRLPTGDFDTEKLTRLNGTKREFELPKVDGNHSGKEQREAFRLAMESK
jgi:hypothetical protein